MAKPVLDDMPGRLRAARAAVEDAKVHLKIELERRNSLAVDAVDGGMTLQAVADLIGVKKQHVGRLCTESQPDVLQQLDDVVEGEPPGG